MRPVLAEEIMKFTIKAQRFAIAGLQVLKFTGGLATLLRSSNVRRSMPEPIRVSRILPHRSVRCGDDLRPCRSRCASVRLAIGIWS